MTEMEMVLASSRDDLAQLDSSSLIPSFLMALDAADSTRKTYQRSLRQFSLWLTETGKELLNLRRGDILEYKKALSERSPYTISTYITAVRRLFEWLEAERIYPNVAKGVRGAKKARGYRKDCLTVPQIREALESFDRSSLEGLRDFALFNLLVRTGLRTIEISRAQVGDLRQESGEAVLWIQGKGRDEKDDFVLLTEEALRPIWEWLSACGKVEETAPLFSSLSPRNHGEELTTRSISRIVKETLRRIALDSSRLTAHSLRHTAVTLAVSGGASLQQAQAMARHSDPRTTMVYFHNLDRVRDGAEKCIQI